MTTKKSVKKMYCRMFQSVMKAGISTIPWRTPKLMKGAGAVRHLPAAIKRRGLKKALIVTGPTLIGRGLLDGVLEEMEEQGLLYVIYNKVEQNPTDENVEDAVKVFLENGCDCMLALGGGAPLDCAKAVGARIARPNRQIRQLQGLFRVVKQIPQYPEMIRKTDVKQIAKWAEKEANPLYPTPEVWNRREFERFLLNVCVQGSSEKDRQCCQDK